MVILSEQSLKLSSDSNTFYKEFGYLVIREFMKEAEASTQAQRMREAREEESAKYGSYWRDTQVPSAYSAGFIYNDMLAERCNQFANIMGLGTLRPVLSYSRIYEHGAELRAHRDRSELQHSATICLSRDSTIWNFCLYDLKGNLVTISQNPGDAVLYQGRLLHWRDQRYQGREHIQVFLHYRETTIISLLKARVSNLMNNKSMKKWIKSALYKVP